MSEMEEELVRGVIRNLSRLIILWILKWQSLHFPDLRPLNLPTAAFFLLLNSANWILLRAWHFSQSTFMCLPSSLKPLYSSDSCLNVVSFQLFFTLWQFSHFLSLNSSLWISKWQSLQVPWSIPVSFPASFLTSLPFNPVSCFTFGWQSSQETFWCFPSSLKLLILLWFRVVCAQLSVEWQFLQFFSFSVSLWIS